MKVPKNKLKQDTRPRVKDKEIDPQFLKKIYEKYTKGNKK
jgi:hypothetical protein